MVSVPSDGLDNYSILFVKVEGYGRTTENPES
jgi:hypothetical protein